MQPLWWKWSSWAKSPRVHSRERKSRTTRLVLESLEDRMLPSVLMVTNRGDKAVAGNGSLRGEILAAQNGDTIEFAHKLKGHAIVLGTEILINKNITIEGPGSGKLTLSATNSRLFEIVADTNVTISGLTLRNGTGTGNNISGEGGAVLNHGTLTLTGDTIKDNTASGLGSTAGQGGAIFDDAGATLTLNGTTLKGNMAQGGVSGAGQGGALYFANGSTGNLTNVAISSNMANGGMACAAQGGGLFATGANLTVNLSTISANLAMAGPGGTSAAGNGGTAQGGGLYLQGGTLAMSTSTVAKNQAQGGNADSGASGQTTGSAGDAGGSGQGGGLFVGAAAATVEITADTFFHNTALGGLGGNGGFGPHAGGAGGDGGNGQGGAICILDQATVNLTNDTIAGNSAVAGAAGLGGSASTGTSGVSGNGGNGQGGGIWAGGGTVTLINDTVAGSSPALFAKGTAGNSALAAPALAGVSDPAVQGSGMGGGLFDAGGTFMTLKNTIVANNTATTAAPDVAGSVTAQDHNLIGNAAGASGFGGSDITGTDPNLTALGTYGGPTQTMLPLGGAAVDGGDDAVAPTADQRGIARPQGAHTDIGAVETDNLSFTILTGNAKNAGRRRRFKPLAVQITEDGHALVGVTVSFAVVPGGTGAGARVKRPQIVTNRRGRATATVVANSTLGSFTVTARVGGLLLTFNLTVG